MAAGDDAASIRSKPKTSPGPASAPPLAFRLFQRVAVQLPDQPMGSGEVYEIYPTQPPRFDVLTYEPDGVPRLYCGLEASALRPDPR